MRHYLGIDIGTSGCRACVIDAAARPLARATAPSPEPVRAGAGVEQDPELWWQALCSCLDRLADQGALDPVVALSLCGTSSTLLCCDGDGRPLTPALMYNDARAVTQAQQIATLAPADCAAHGPGSSLAKLLYLLAGGLPGTARFALHQADWLLGRLAGQYGSSDENNALKLGYDPVNRCWPGWLETLDIPLRLLPRVVPPGQVIGRIDARLCRRWGLCAETRIISGTTDSTAAFIATGAGTGEGVTSLGSTLVLKVGSPVPVFSPAHGIYSHRLDNRWLAGGASNSGGNVLLQFFTSEDIVRLSAQMTPDTPTGLDYYPLPGPGERFPVNDPTLPPCLEPRPPQDAQFLQGMLEGMAAIERRGYRLLESLGAPYPKRVLSAGGGAVNAAWRDIREAILGVPVIATAHQEAAYGTALLARRGANEATEDQ